VTTTVGTITILAALIAFMGIQTFWVVRSLDRIDARLDRIEGLLMNFGERIARLEEHQERRP
jgi:hypothetical protein